MHQWPSNYESVLKWNAYEMPREYGIRVLTKGSKRIQSLNHKHYFKLVLHVFFPQINFFIQIFWIFFFQLIMKNDKNCPIIQENY
jgi:hypothetical protein